MSPTLRQAEAKDVVAMFSMWRALISHEQSTWPEGAAYPQIDLDNGDHTMPWFEGYAQRVADDNCRIWLAEVDGQPVGFAVAYHWQRIQGEPKFAIEAKEMYVKPEYRRGAKVAKLFEEAIEGWAEAEQVEVIECSCTATGPQTDRWLKKGFIPYQVTLYRPAKWKVRT